LKFKNSVFEGKAIFSSFVKICKKFKLSESWHAALVSFSKTPQKLSLQKISRKSIISTNFMTKGNHKSTAISFEKCHFINIIKWV